MYTWDIHHVKNHQDSSEEPPASSQTPRITLCGHFVEPGIWTTFQEERDLKIDMHLPWCILEASTISKTTNTPLRNLQRPHRLQRWHLDDALENPGVGPVSRWAETWNLICSFLDVYLRHSPCQKPPRFPWGTSSILSDSKDNTLRTLRRTQDLDHFPGGERSEN